MMTRRKLLKNFFALSASIPFSHFLKAENYGALPHFFLLFDFPGGWDVTLAFDPLSHNDYNTAQGTDLFLEYNDEDVFRSGSLKLGPAALSLVPFAKDICIINGIDGRRDGGHDVNRLMMLSGFAHSNPASLPFEIFERSLFKGTSGVFLPTRNIFPQAGYSTQTFGVDRLKQVSNLNEDYFEDVLGFADILGNYRMQVANLKRAQKIHEKHFGDKEFGADQFGPAIASLFASKSVFQAALSMGDEGDLDTHQAHERAHLESLRARFEEVAQILSDLQKVEFESTGLSVYDLTTTYISSEFARTPQLNGSQGKDHNPYTNSVALISRRVKGETSVGASYLRPRAIGHFSEHAGCALDYETGETYDYLRLPQLEGLARISGFEGGGKEQKLEALLQHTKLRPIFPENVVATLGQLLGVDENFYKTQFGISERPLILPGVAKNK